MDLAAAGGIAERFIMAALTWDQDDPDVTARAVGPLWAGGPSLLGWNKTGRQQASNATAVSFEATTETVTVAVMVDLVIFDADTTRTDGWKPREPTTMIVACTIGVAGPRMVAVAGPVPTGLGAASPPRMADEVGGEDSVLTGQTRTLAEAFFRAFATGDVSAVEAPGSNIPAPTPSSWQFKALTTWAVFSDPRSPASPPSQVARRTAQATIEWSRDDGSVWTTTYRVGLEHVSAPTGGRWQIAHLQPH